MFTLKRLTARLAVIAALGGLLTAACNTDANGPSDPALLAHKAGGGGAVASGFAVLSNAAVTCTGGSIIGDVGTFQASPPGAITPTEGCVITGASDVGGPAAVAAYNVFLDQYAALAPQPGDICPVITGTLADMTLDPGVYCVSDEAKTGVLTLRGGANATWLIKVPSGALTGTNFDVVLAGGAQACNVTWWVDAATTMTTSDLVGNILAGAAITFTGGTLNGNAYAGAAGVGDVTFTGTAVTGCEGGKVKPPKPPKHHLKLHPDGFGPHSYAAWKAHEGLPDATGHANSALYFQKMTTTATNAAGVAVIRGLKGEPVSALTSLAWDHRTDGWCGAGAPRWDIFVKDAAGNNYTVFLGCAAAAHTPVVGTTNWIRDSYDAAAISAAIAAAVGSATGPFTITGLMIVFDEGTDIDGNPGFVFLDNITVNSQTWTSPADNGEGRKGHHKGRKGH